ncbi:D(1) dopamine receptor [Lingula anatina]|uniref:D(1) dopamine receptor n=1 Tax=Lingula anatina TaxID=7574 RepID=A0A1S3K9H7_LINAN|nr:D(1) dopamine receptor [Lingula anatina]XP_013419283.1 D(1) dopamine receptor [Lingula anatina]XP_013419284.1 D(1) dopamine receptor [Lingula anatina]|eukprot:XP_013419282.1 D(1) dopamine receptor [Lingula anatina]
MATTMSAINATLNATEAPYQALCAAGHDPAPSPIPTGVRIFLGVLLSIIDLAVILGNLLVVIAILKFEQLRSKITNYFIVSLAISDMCVGVFVLPFAAIQDLLGNWPFGHYCLTWVSFDVMMSTASILNLLMIAVERYIAVTRPFHYHEIVTNKTAGIMLGVAWIASGMVSFIPLQLEWFYFEGDYRWHQWATDQALGPLCKLAFNPYYAIISSSISFYVPLIMMTFLYGRVFAIARRQAKQIADMDKAMANVRKDGKGTKRSENKATKTMATVMGVFILCWLPFFILNCLLGWDPEMLLCKLNPNFMDIFSFFVWLGWINSVFNPFIYSLNPSFRAAYRKILCRCCGKGQSRARGYYEDYTVSTVG